ncbi:MAG: hypothetical protein GQ559_05180 [Desulfobulbaceae bacterium]|nr:hypothetical protein [Desulfobulbaceae bacterium]
MKRINAAPIGLFCLLCIVTSAWATQQESDVIEPAHPLQIEHETVVSFEYILEGRPDPFVPFISPKAVTRAPLLNPDEIIDEDVELTGMRQFEPGQLTLVAVLSSSGQKMAMVEDVSGRGYILNEGILIGRRGVVSQINQQQVLVTETAHTRAGKELVNTVVMRLKKEGDE